MEGSFGVPARARAKVHIAPGQWQGRACKWLLGATGCHLAVALTPFFGGLAVLGLKRGAYEAPAHIPGSKTLAVRVLQKHATESQSP